MLQRRFSIEGLKSYRAGVGHLGRLIYDILLSKFIPNSRNGLKRTAKLVDYESDDDESNPDDSSQSDRKSKKSKAGPALNGWKVLGSGDEAGGSVGTMMSRGAASASGMEWSVVPVTPP